MAMPKPADMPVAMLELLAATDPDSLTPRQALEVLYQLKSLADTQ